MRERNPFASFLPRSASAFVFTLALVCYDWALTALFGAIVRLFHFSPRPLEFWETHGDPMAIAVVTLVFAPVIYSRTTQSRSGDVHHCICDPSDLTPM